MLINFLESCEQNIIFVTINYYCVMPKIFEYFGFVFYFYSNEHDPIHVHVAYGEFENIFVMKQVIQNTKIIKKL